MADISYKTFINPCKMYARVTATNEIVKINGFKVELDAVTLYCGSSAAGYSERRYFLEEVEIFQQ